MVCKDRLLKKSCYQNSKLAQVFTWLSNIVHVQKLCANERDFSTHKSFFGLLIMPNSPHQLQNSAYSIHTARIQ